MKGNSTRTSVPPNVEPPQVLKAWHLHPLLDHSGDLRLFVAAAEVFARGQVLESIQTAVKLGRMTALSKADGGVRGIVAGDVHNDVSTIDGSGAIGHFSVPGQDANVSPTCCKG